MERGKPINTTKIKYIKVEDKIYEATTISFSDMHIQAVETDLDTIDIPASELFDLSELIEFRIILENKKGHRIALENFKGQAEIICLDEWKRKQI